MFIRLCDCCRNREASRGKPGSVHDIVKERGLEETDIRKTWLPRAALARAYPNSLREQQTVLLVLSQSRVVVGVFARVKESLLMRSGMLVAIRRGVCYLRRRGTSKVMEMAGFATASAQKLEVVMSSHSRS